VVVCRLLVVGWRTGRVMGGERRQHNTLKFPDLNP
jgi:hypothetical protein